MLGKEEIEFNYTGSPARMTEYSSRPRGLTMNLAVKNAVQMFGIDLPLAGKMASTNPVRVLELKNKSRISKGFNADWVLLDAK